MTSGFFELIIDGKVRGWMTKECYEAEKKLAAKSYTRTCASLVPECRKKQEARAILNEDNRKWAWIIVGKTRKMAWVDNKTMRAYRRDGYKPTYMEIKKFTFERWCTSFDL